MKKTFLIILLGLSAAAVGVAFSQPRRDPLWSGPSPMPQWVGLFPGGVLVQKNALSPVVSKDPEFLGYFKRAGVWHVRLGGAGEVETLKQGESSADGWLVSEIKMRRGRVHGIMLQRANESLELELKN